MDLAYLTDQRPADALSMTEHDITDCHLIITQEKTMQPLRIQIVGQLTKLLTRIVERKAGHQVRTAALLVNEHGKRLSASTLCRHFDTALAKASDKNPIRADEIEAFWFYDPRAKAADDTSDDR